MQTWEREKGYMAAVISRDGLRLEERKEEQQQNSSQRQDVEEDRQMVW